MSGDDDAVVIDTDTVISAVGYDLQATLDRLAGKPLTFVLLVSDGHEHTITANASPPVIQVMLEGALDRLLIDTMRTRHAHEATP